jgi:hypothetical protein
MVAAPDFFVPPSELDPLVRALTYPYAAPEHDYRFRDGTAHAVDGLSAGDRADRVPVLAFGSNRAPDQLRRKFAGLAGVEIGVERARLAEFDVVYSAHLSGYGAVAATLLDSPGTVVDLAITWLPPRLMARMHATEGVGLYYDFVELDGLALATRSGARHGRVFAYVCRFGALVGPQGPLALAPITAAARRFAALDQRGAQTIAIAKLGLRKTVEAFITENVAEPARRQAREAGLAADARALGWPALRCIAL